MVGLTDSVRPGLAQRLEKILALDRLARLAGRPAYLAPETITRLNKLIPFPHEGGIVDLNLNADSERYARVAAILAEDEGVDVILVIHVPTLADMPENVATRLLEAAAGKPLMTCWMGGATVARALEHLEKVMLGAIVEELRADAAASNQIPTQSSDAGNTQHAA